MGRKNERKMGRRNDRTKGRWDEGTIERGYEGTKERSRLAQRNPAHPGIQIGVVLLTSFFNSLIPNNGILISRSCCRKFDIEVRRAT